MMKRPTSVTVIAWILIVMSGISLLTSTLSFKNPMTRELMAKSLLPVPIQFAMLYAGLIITIVAAIAMLKGMNWGRLLYVVWGIIGFLIGFATSPMKMAMIPGLVVFAVIVFFLFRPKVNDYFSGKKAADDAQSI